MSDFVHLHVRTHYSVLDGLLKVPQLTKRIAEHGMNAVALTDAGSLSGAVEFQQSCQKQGIKPIIGCEISVVHPHDPRPQTLVVLCRNLEGYRNLVGLVSRGHLESEDGQMSIDEDALREHAGGLLALSGNLGGAIPQALLRSQQEIAEQLVQTYRDIFGTEHFFIELQRHEGLPEQAVVNRSLMDLHHRFEVPVVATADCRYLDPAHADAQAILVCIGIDKRVDLDDLAALPVRDLYVRSTEEMVALFDDIPEAIENTRRIADLCDVTIPLGEVFLPAYAVPESHTIESYFKELAVEGLEGRFADFRGIGFTFDEEEYRDRLDHEMETILQMGYPGYFLIVWDFINYAREQGIPVGPGRGSGAGSVVAYSLRITNVNPIEYGLLFERFLNPERVSMPDFDIDFCQNRRGEVIEYVTRKYGSNNVGQIITFGQLKAKACIRDISRVLNLPYSEADRLAKLIPPTLNIKLDQAYKEEPRLREAVQADEQLQRLFELARAIEGTNRNTGMHAAGIVISDSPLWDYVPVTKGVNGENVTQFAKDEVELAGLVKFDFLGLRNLTVIADAVRLVNDQRAEGTQPLDIDTIRVDDKGVYDLLSSGDTLGIFQMESSGFQELIKKLRPSCFEDIIAAGALYRPGPLSSGMVDDFIACKHGQKKAVYPHPLVEPILQETYGVIVYQEQVMQIAQVLAAYTLGAADLLRRAMGKKKPEVMAKQRSIFLEGARQQEVNQRIAEEIFDKMALFAGYGFNKSHSAAYAMVTYQTAYLKAHHPVHFMAALMTNDSDRTERVVRLIHEARNMGISVQPPDINASDFSFTVNSGAIRFGLGALKGVGAGAIEIIVEGRQRRPFRNLYDFCEEVDLHRVNRRVVETLIKCGAFDALADRKLEVGDLEAIGGWRAALFAAVPQAVELGQKAQTDRDVGQAVLALFGDGPGAETAVAAYPKVEPWSDKVLLEAEKECLGFYVSGHPLDRYEDELKLYTSHTTRTLESAAERSDIRICGVVSSIRERKSKRGTGRHAFAMLEDRYGRIEVLVFSRVYGECEELVKSGQPILVAGSLKIEGDEEPRERKIVCNSVQLLEDARKASIRRVIIRLPTAFDDHHAKALRALLEQFPGECNTSLNLHVELAGDAHFQLPERFRVEPTDDLMTGVERLLGRGSVHLA